TPAFKWCIRLLIVKIMKKISILELANLMGGYRSCEEVKYAGNTHFRKANLSPEEQDAEDAFWRDWLEEFDRWCM
ncbi:MAG: hypothetical protein K2G13_00890, partial [Muribaculaceae bacterium]|nr:hypothetical protein [Muribaculaceae bacterium]